MNSEHFFLCTLDIRCRSFCTSSLTQLKDGIQLHSILRPFVSNKLVCLP